jgi:hypothetical protein
LEKHVTILDFIHHHNLMHVSTKIIKILLIYITNIHTQLSKIYPPPPFADQYVPFGLNDLCQYGRTTRNIEELKNIYCITLRHLDQHTYVQNFKRFKHFKYLKKIF